MSKKEKPLKYESVENVGRWNMCQKIAKLLYKSKRHNNDIEFELEALESEIINNNN